jgi:hypothetical protein
MVTQMDAGPLIGTRVRVRLITGSRVTAILTGVGDREIRLLRGEAVKRYQYNEIQDIEEVETR